METPSDSTEHATSTTTAVARKKLLEAASDVEHSEFDYIIVGSGAGGGPLACRLAMAGRRVLVLEAGEDPMLAKSTQFPKAAPGELYQIPGFHGAATEDVQMSWQFSVRHFDDDATQKLDSKYNRLNAVVNDETNPATSYPPDPRFLDPGSRGGLGKGGIFYPRSSNIGGCTAHHAMIVVVPNDSDWTRIAELTGDDSWRPANMRGYFARLEQCLYRDDYDNFLQKAFGWVGGLFFRTWRWIVLQLDPRAMLDDGGHGHKGWQPTSFIDPSLVENIAKKDKGFIEVLARSALSVIYQDRPLIGIIKKALLKLRVVQQLDPNDINTRRVSPEGVFLIPTGIQSPRPEKSAELNYPHAAGCRVGVREFLLDTAQKHPEHLVIETGVHVTRVLFADDDTGGPRAIGVEFARGHNLYEASPLQPKPNELPRDRNRIFVRECTGEVILSGGAFNTPQLLMLSGIGDATVLSKVPAGPQDQDSAAETAECVLRDRKGNPLRDPNNQMRRIHLPGVGKNLQDRYEVSVVSEINRSFDTLKGVSFVPGDRADPAREQWLKTKGGLYRTNGGTIAILKRSRLREPDEPEPDLFTFGVPAAFRGYYWGWSREFFRPTIGAAELQQNLWSWVILKAYTENHAGRVALRTTNPFHTPEICFDSFNEHAEKEKSRLIAAIAAVEQQGLPTDALEQQLREVEIRAANGARDLEALVDAIESIRAINARNHDQFVREIQPGAALPDKSDALKQWVRTQAWGHHCSCTCRIGSDAWQDDTSKLKDKGAVLDSHFRVHGVKGLRVVDASVFPSIPGYFILAPLLMVSEKAADTLILERPPASYYPPDFEKQEAKAVRQRREKAGLLVPAGMSDRLPTNTVGLALSGGGIRSATFSFGVLQALASKGRLREIDLLSTVSGGGFAGSFLGRLFTRQSVKSAADPVGRVQSVLNDADSAPLWWMRMNANYIFASGAADVRYNLAVFWRNLLTVHLVIGTLLFAVFGWAAWLSHELPIPAVPQIAGMTVSIWAWLPLGLFTLAIVPLTLGYWLAPRPGSYRVFPPYGFLVWLILLVGATAVLFVPEGALLGIGGIIILGLTLIVQELARLRADVRDAQENQGEQIGAVVRNRITRATGEALAIFALLFSIAILDTFALLFAKNRSSGSIAAVMAMLGPLLPILRWIGLRAQREVSDAFKRGAVVMVAKLLGVPLAVGLLFVIDVAAHKVVSQSPGCGWGLLAISIALAVSLALGRAFDFLNLSSLHATYAARLTRTFLGASNERRIYSSTSNDARDVRLAHPEDDIPFDRYHPEEQGGPLHFINVTINETVDLASNRQVRERKGLPMCLGPCGVSVGRSYFASWCPPDDRPSWQKRRRRLEGIDGDDTKRIELRRLVALEALRTTSSPNTFHVLASKASKSVEAEPLSLGAWTAISGAAYTTGQGRATSAPLSLFLGIANVRLGYWWDSGILEQEHPGRFPPSLWGRVKRIPDSFFRMQSQLLAEWRGRFHGPSRWFWYLSDGGHFELTGAYELIRRRVAFIIVVDAGADPAYDWSDFGMLVRQVRMDFGAQIEWIDPTGTEMANVPNWILVWIDNAEIGLRSQIKHQTKKHAALACVTYDDDSSVSWLLLMKPSLADHLPEDVLAYARTNKSFPQQSTIDQVFDDAQWESYRKLGEAIGRRVFAP